MFRLLRLALPFIMTAPSQNSARALAGFLAIYSLFGLGLVFLMCGFILITTRYFGIEIAIFGAAAVMLLSAAVTHFFFKRSRKTTTSTTDNVANDPIGKYLPAAVTENPTVKALLDQIGSNPVSATAAAVAVGMLLSKEFLGDDS